MPSVAACQLSVTDLDPETNTEAIVQRIHELPEDVELAVFPEYSVTGFVADARVNAYALERDSPELEHISQSAQEASMDVVVGVLERADPALYNSLLYIESSGDVTQYRKRHLWEDEAEFVCPGDDRVVVDTPLGRAGLVTCYDLNFVAESAAFTDPPVDALLVAGAWPAAYAANWDLLLRARALDGVRWVIGAGRTGAQDVPGTDKAVYAGRSAIVRPDGSVAARLNRQERSLVRTIDPAELAAHREFIGSVG